MKQYLNLMQDILDNGVAKGDRTGTGTISVFGRQLRFNLADGFPLVTTKRVSFKSIVVELLWFLIGSTNIKYLSDYGVTIWDEWANAQGEVGPMYGKQWRAWQCPDGRVVDQISDLVNQLRNNPNSRRMLVSAWNVADLPNESIDPISNVGDGKMALAACHAMFQFYVAEGRLSCQVYQRSCDYFLGVPFNIASYALLTHMLAKVTGLMPGELVWTGGDIHLYNNHIEQAKEQLKRDPHTLPVLHIAGDHSCLDSIKVFDIVLQGYRHHEVLKAPISR